MVPRQTPWHSEEMRVKAASGKGLGVSWILGMVCVLNLAGCAGMQQAYRDQICHAEGGYERGMNDARTGEPMNQSFANACEGAGREAALKGYREGYTAGLASVQAEKPKTQINVNIGGSPGNSKKFYCEVRAFTQKFSAWGATELEAKVEAQKRCMERYHEMHCGDVSCQR